MRIFFIFLMVLVGAQTPSHAEFPTITGQPSSRALWAGGNVTFAVATSGTGPFAYQWQFGTTNLPDGIITTVAGNGTNTYSGDGGAAANAGLHGPADIAEDGSGDLFIADSVNNRIRKVSTNGIITTVAGNGTNTYSGDGGAATNASLNLPLGVAKDAAGNLYIGDLGNNRVRKVGTDGVITTVAGNGTNTYSGDGGAATNAGLYGPGGVAVDASGNLFIVDYGHHRIRKVDTNGIITTVAGNGMQIYSGDGAAATNAGMNPHRVTVDASGNLFVADSFNNRIRKVDTNGTITTVAGNGFNEYPNDGDAATNASLSFPEGVAVDTSSNLLIADTGNHRIRIVDPDGIITTVAGNGGFGDYSGDGGAATNAALNSPSCVGVDTSGNLFIADYGNNRVRKVTNTHGPTLALNNVTAADAGNYQVVVTGPGGSVTSSVANLIVATSPLIYQTVANSDGSIALSLVSQPGSTNLVLSATNLSPPIVWQPILTNIAGADGNWHFTDTNAASYQTRFYRSLTH